MELQSGLFKMTEEIKDIIDSKMAEYLPVSMYVEFPKFVPMKFFLAC